MIKDEYILTNARKAIKNYPQIIFANGRQISEIFCGTHSTIAVLHEIDLKVNNPGNFEYLSKLSRHTV
jgi:hypothetical protein